MPIIEWVTVVVVVHVGVIDALSQKKRARIKRKQSPLALGVFRSNTLEGARGQREGRTLAADRPTGHCNHYGNKQNVSFFIKIFPRHAARYYAVGASDQRSRCWQVDSCDNKTHAASAQAAWKWSFVHTEHNIHRVHIFPPRVVSTRAPLLHILNLRPQINIWPGAENHWISPPVWHYCAVSPSKIYIPNTPLSKIHCNEKKDNWIRPKFLDF